MKTLRILLLLLLTFSIALTSLTSCKKDDEVPTEDPTPETKVDPATCGHFVTENKNRKEATCSTEGYTGDEICYACGTTVKTGKAIATTEHNYKDGKCTACGADEPASEFDAQIEAWKAEYSTITIAEALTLCEQFVSSPSTDRYYIIATVKSVDDTAYGKLMIEDETGSIMVYGTNNADGSLKYDQAGLSLKAGDLILIYGTLQNYNGSTKEVQNAWLIDSVSGTVVPPSIDVSSGDTITVEKALEIAGAVAGQDYFFYINANVVSITNAAYGAMVIADETGEISIYNSKNADGTVDYSAMEDKPYKGDTVLVKVVLHLHNGTPEVQQAYIVEFTHNAPALNPDDYTLSTIADARLAADETVVKVQGVVARITFANGFIPSGFYLIDNTSSIYVYDGDLAARVAIGNTVTVVGEKDHWILDTEVNNANKFGYQGCNQLTNCVLASNDGGNTAFDTSWITEKTVKEIVETPVTEDISTLVYKVNALVKEVPGTGFINFYFFDLDGTTSSYAYTQCNGNDFTWLRQFEGKICTVYLSALNAKSTATDCYWRFIPVAVVDEGFTFDPTNAPKFAVDYHALGQFFDSYSADPELELITTLSSELLGFEGVSISYTTSNDSVVFFTVADGKTVMHTKGSGTATVTITATLGAVTCSDTVQITVTAADEYDYITVGEAINAELGSTVTVKGIVGPSLVNQTGFYLMDDSGFIAVTMNADVLATLEMGQMVILQGTRDRKFKTEYEATCHGQTQIKDCTILTNLYGNHTYSSENFVTDITIEEFYAFDEGIDLTTTAYVMKVYVYNESNSIKIGNKDGSVKSNLYASGKSGYEWLAAYAGQEVTLEVAACNWNSKAYYAGCVLAIVLEDGTKIYNTTNFDKY